MKTLTLNDLSVGMSAEISVQKIALASLRAKFLALGLTRGAKIKVVGTNPTGDLLIVEIRGSTLALRREEAEFVSLGSVDSAEELLGNEASLDAAAVVPALKISKS